MAGNGVRRGLIALVLLVAVVGAGVVLAGGALLQDEGDADGTPENATISQENRTVDTDRVNVTIQLDPSDELATDELQYELVVVGEVAAANDAANDTVDCNGELCVVDGAVSADASGEELPQYELGGVVTSASPESGYTANVTGTLEGDAVEGLGLGAYNVTAPNGTDAVNDSVVTDMESGSDQETTDADESASASDDSEAADGGEASDGEATDAEPLQTDGGTSEGDTSDDASEGETDGDDASENDESSGESPSVTFDGCSTATVEGDAYAYEAGLRYYVSDGLDTSTIDQSDISTPTTIEGDELIGDARTTDVVVETVLVLDEDFGILTQASNPNYEDCVDEIEQQHADWEDERGDENASA